MDRNKFEIHYSNEFQNVFGCMVIYPETFFPATKAAMKKLNKVVQMDLETCDTFWADVIEAIQTDTTKYIDGQIAAYERIAEEAIDKTTKKEAKAVVNAYKRDRKKLKGNIEFIKENFMKG